MPQLRFSRSAPNRRALSNRRRFIPRVEPLEERFAPATAFTSQPDSFAPPSASPAGPSSFSSQPLFASPTFSGGASNSSVASSNQASFGPLIVSNMVNNALGTSTYSQVPGSALNQSGYPYWQMLFAQQPTLANEVVNGGPLPIYFITSAADVSRFPMPGSAVMTYAANGTPADLLQRMQNIPLAMRSPNAALPPVSSGAGGVMTVVPSQPEPGRTSTGTLIQGTVFRDPNGNGVQDGDEPGIANVKVVLEMQRGKAFQEVDHTSTDFSGHYTFTELPLGTYRVRVVPPAGVRLTTTNTRAVSVGPSTHAVDRNFGLTPEQPRRRPPRPAEGTPGEGKVGVPTPMLTPAVLDRVYEDLADPAPLPRPVVQTARATGADGAEGGLLLAVAVALAEWNMGPEKDAEEAERR